MVRSTLAGPARMRTSPTATLSRTKPAAASRNSVMAQQPAEQRFLPREIGGDRLVDVQAMDQQLALAGSVRRQRAGQQARQSTEGAQRAARQIGTVSDETRFDGHRGAK